MKRISIAVLLFFAPLLALAASLSLDQIIQLHVAGIGDAVIAHQVAANGISFEPDATSLLALRKAGFSDTVLDAVVKATPGTARTPGGAPASDQIADLYKAKKYPELADLLQAKIRANSATDRERTILVLTLLKLDNSEEAKLQFEQLQGRFPTSGFVPQLTAILEQADERKRLRAPLDDAIKSLKYTEVVSVIKSSRLSGGDKRDMLVDAAVTAADFESAKGLLGDRAGLSYTEQSLLKDREQRLSSQENEFAAAFKAADKFVHSPATVSYCNGATPGNYGPELAGPDFTVATYLDAVQKLTGLAPLNSSVMNFVFHATMVSAAYQDVETVGDRILAATGAIHIPAYSKDRFFWLVIDQQSKKLLTEPDDRPFSFINGYPASNVELVAFNVSLNDITGLTQHAGGSAWGPGSGFTTNPLQIAPSSHALKVAPTGLVPQYALMAFLQCSMGQGFQQRATYNLGAYVQHVVHLDAKRVSLVEPKDVNKVAGGGFTAFLAAAGGAMGVSGAAYVAQDLQSSQAALADAQKRRSLLSSMGRFAFSVAESSSVKDLESKLNLSASQ